MCLGAQYPRLNQALNPNLSQVCGLTAAWGAQFVQKGQRLLLDG